MDPGSPNPGDQQDPLDPAVKCLRLEEDPTIQDDNVDPVQWIGNLDQGN